MNYPETALFHSELVLSNNFTIVCHYISVVEILNMLNMHSLKLKFLVSLSVGIIDLTPVSLYLFRFRLNVTDWNSLLSAFKTTGVSL